MRLFLKQGPILTQTALEVVEMRNAQRLEKINVCLCNVVNIIDADGTHSHD